MPTQNVTFYCCQTGVGDSSSSVKAGDCGTSELSITNITISNYDTWFSPYDEAYILSRTCLEFVCKSGNLYVRATVGCVPKFVLTVNPSFTVECDVMLGAVPLHRTITLTATDCPMGTCPEVCS